MRKKEKHSAAAAWETVRARLCVSGGSGGGFFQFQIFSSNISVRRPLQSAAARGILWRNEPTRAVFPLFFLLLCMCASHLVRWWEDNI